MKDKNTLISLMVAASLTACGGGGSGEDPVKDSENKTNENPSFDYIFGIKSSYDCTGTVFKVINSRSGDSMYEAVYKKPLVNLKDNTKRLESRIPIIDGNYELSISCGEKGSKRKYDIWVADRKMNMYENIDGGESYD